MLPVFAAGQMPEFLCEIGIKFYNQGRYAEAMDEFKKALMLQPGYAPALKYIEMLQEMQGETGEEEIEEVIPLAYQPSSSSAIGAMQEILDLIELQREMAKEMPRQPGPIKMPAVSAAPELKAAQKEALPPKILFLDDSFNSVIQPIEIAEGSSIIIRGKLIQRFLVTEPTLLTVEKKSADEVLVTAKNIGYTYLHIWDSSGRWTTEWLGVPKKPEGPTYAELARREEEKAHNFRLHYYLDYSAHSTGRGVSTLKRTNYSWIHNIGFNGETPYADLDYLAIIRRLQTTDISYMTLGFKNGKIGPFKDFYIRGGDHNPGFSNLSFPGTTVRGAMFNSPAFDKKIDYTVFWGRESGGRSGLSPTLSKSKYSFLNGFNLDYSPTKKQNYNFSLLHGYGRDRQSYLRRYGYDFSADRDFDKLGLAYDIAYDSRKFAQLLKANYIAPKMKLSAELRDVNKSYLSITGTGWAQGELGSLFNLTLAPTEKLKITSRLDIYQDRLYPAEDNKYRPNEDFDLNASYQIDPSAALDASYSLQNELGRLSQTRYQNASMGINKKFRLIRDISTYAIYTHQENKSYTAPSVNYIDDKINLGLRFSLIGQLYYYLTKEFNWLNERYTGRWSNPNALETGLDWSNQIDNTPFYGTFRFSWRDEEDASSPLSFLAGQDYIEGYSELSYKPTAGTEVYGSCRVRNVWADKSGVAKRIEASFNTGMRLLWNTGVRWDSVCNIDGFVFKDLNSDGLRQRDEPPVEGIKIWLGKDRSCLTDLFGYYKFKGVRGRKAYVSLDMNTLPSGFLVTVPPNQEVAIANGQTLRADFGIMSNSEIKGAVFDDKDADGKYDSDEKGVEGVVVILEDGKKAKTDNAGRYSFSNMLPGEHTITADIGSIPVYYLPKVALTKKITLFEGVTYLYNIPLRRIEDK